MVFDNGIKLSLCRSDSLVEIFETKISDVVSAYGDR